MGVRPSLDYPVREIHEVPPYLSFKTARGLADAAHCFQWCPWMGDNAIQNERINPTSRPHQLFCTHVMAGGHGKHDLAVRLSSHDECHKPRVNVGPAENCDLLPASLPTSPKPVTRRHCTSAVQTSWSKVQIP